MVVPLVYNGTILPRKAPFWAFCGDFAGRATPAPSSPNVRTILQGYIKQAALQSEFSLFCFARLIAQLLQKNKKNSGCLFMHAGE